MKVRASVKKICKNCKVVRRQGVVRIQVVKGSRTVVSTQVFVAGSNCRYGTRVIVPRSVSGTVHVRARFLGNALLTPHSAKTQNVRVG